MVEESLILSGVSTLRNIGFFDFLLPFLLFFTVIYGVLSKSNIFTGPKGEERKDINAVVAFVISLIATTTSWVLLSLNYFLPWIGFIAIVILGFLILGSMAAGGDITSELRKYSYIGIPLMAISVFVIMFFSLGWNEALGGTGLSDTDIALILIGVFAAIIFMAIIRGGGKSSEKKG